MNESTQIDSTEEEGTGNTEQSPPHKRPRTNVQDTQAYIWCFTAPKTYVNKEGEIQNYTNESQLSQDLDTWCKKWVFQEELSAEGYAHYQGVCTLRVKHRLNEVKNMFGDKIHFERCKGWWQSEKYCTKTDTRVAGPWTNNTPPMPFVQTLRNWQQQVVDIYGEQRDHDTRTINWIYDIIGNTGKSELVRYLAMKHAATVLTAGKHADLAYAVPTTATLVCFDFARTLEGRIPYQPMESIKNGMIFSPKYASGMKMFKSPVVMCFANFLPTFASLSLDRWNILEIIRTTEETDGWELRKIPTTTFILPN